MKKYDEDKYLLDVFGKEVAEERSVKINENDSYAQTQNEIRTWKTREGKTKRNISWCLKIYLNWSFTAFQIKLKWNES